MSIPVLDQWLLHRLGLPCDKCLPSRKELNDWQVKHLREIVAHAKQQSPFYRNHLQSVEPEAIRSLDAYACLPFLSPKHVRDNPEQLLCVSQDAIERIVTVFSSGTTGSPKRMYYTAEDIAATCDFFAWGMSNLVDVGETVLLLMPADRPGGVGKLLHIALSNIGVRVVSHGMIKEGSQAVTDCLKENAVCLIGAPAHLNLFTAAWKARGLPPKGIRSVLFCWDAAPEAVVRTVEEGLGCQVFRHWGMIETGLGGAVECAPHSGMHIREPDVYIEVVCPQSGMVLPDGQVGELVISTPLKTGMPLIRYRTGDMGRILQGECLCGSPLRRLDQMVYRQEASCAVGDGEIHLHALDEAIYGVPGVADYRVEMNKRKISLVVYGTTHGLLKAVRLRVESIPAIHQAIAEEALSLEISVQPKLIPAVAGLQKRRFFNGGREE